MSNQHAAVVVLESINVFTVNIAGARNLTQDATTANVGGQGHATCVRQQAVEYSMDGSFTVLAAYVNAISELDNKPFEDNVAAKVISAYAGAVHAYVGLMQALIDKHSVLISSGSPLAPDGAVVGVKIAQLQFAIAIFQGWLALFVPSRVKDLNKLGEEAYAAFEKAAVVYPKPSGKETKSLKTSGTLKVPEAPKKA
ncbi:hypothetical protein HDZ31DRAFT_72002 [Schizophyllum fasciatum]